MRLSIKPTTPRKYALAAILIILAITAGIKLTAGGVSLPSAKAAADNWTAQPLARELSHYSIIKITSKGQMTLPVEI